MSGSAFWSQIKPTLLVFGRSVLGTMASWTWRFFDDLMSCHCCRHYCSAVPCEQLGEAPYGRAIELYLQLLLLDHALQQPGARHVGWHARLGGYIPGTVLSVSRHTHSTEPGR